MLTKYLLNGKSSYVGPAKLAYKTLSVVVLLSFVEYLIVSVYC